MRSNSKWLVALAALMFCAPAAAQTLYKLIDKNGKVTYSETAPKSFDGQVIRIDIDPNANTMTMPKPEKAGPSGEPARKAEQPRKSEDGKVKAVDPDIARDRLEAAKNALEDARNNPKEGEMTWVGKVGGGTRPVLSEDYQRRLERLEVAVKNAEEDLRRAEAR